MPLKYSVIPEETLQQGFMDFQNAVVMGIVESLQSTFEGLKEFLKWGDDHEMEAIPNSNEGEASVDFTITVPHLRNRPEENARLETETIPAFFENNFTALAIGLVGSIATKIVGIF